MRLHDILHHPTSPDEMLLVAVPEASVAVVTVRTRHGLRRRTRRTMVPAATPVVAIRAPGDRGDHCSVEVRTATGSRRTRPVRPRTASASAGRR